jgi:predicted nucleic acid-binding protein
MIYADTDFFLALLKDSDWLKTSAKRLLHIHKNEIRTSPVTLIELLLVSAQFYIDPERLIADALELAQIQGGEVTPILIAAHYIKNKGVGVFDSLHAAFCGVEGTIISSDKVFDRLGLDRIPIESS